MSEEVAPGNQPPDPDAHAPPEVTISKIEDRRRLDNYLNQNDVQELLVDLTQSRFARTQSQLMNIVSTFLELHSRRKSKITEILRIVLL